MNTTEFVESYPQRISYTAPRVVLDPLVLAETEIERYDRPRADTVFPREYAFHLLGNLIGRTVIDLGCGDGVNSVILASLGARVFSIDISGHSLDQTAQRAAANRVDNRVTLLHSDATAIPLDASSVDAVLCTALLHQVDPIQTARQIRRVLRPGGVAIFDSHLNIHTVDAVCRAVGKRGRRRGFWLSTQFVPAARAAQRLDAVVLQRFSFARKLALPFVWEAKKER